MRYQRRQARRARQIRAAIHVIGDVAAFLGFMCILGAAGSSDLGAPWAEFGPWAIWGAPLMAAGMAANDLI